MNLAEEIRKKFANLPSNKSWRLTEVNSLYPSWVIRTGDEYAVGIEVNEKTEVNEAFANVFFYTGYFEVEDKQKKILLLSSNDENLRYEFAGICALFLETGENDEKRKSIINNPIKWWEKWKSLIGNKDIDQTVHGVLGELIVLYSLALNDKDLRADSWRGPEGNSLDIQTHKGNYEVKTSLIKYNNVVTISGQYQMDPEENLSLMLVKLEEVTEGGITIDTMIAKLINMGFDYQLLNKNINKLGFKENSISRKKQYRFLELREYAVDEKFPFINMNNLNNLEKREHIVQINYKVNLTGLDYRLIDLNLHS